MTFKVLKPDTQEVVLGDLTEENDYIKTFGAPRPGQRPPLQLAVGESSKVVYHLGGNTGTYEVRRVA